MKAFHTIAVPHKDILEGRLTMDIYAADLWEVSQGRGPDEYKDADTFFQKTYLTQGLDNLLNIVEKRLKGKGGDPVIQIQTPFGGGKTHALIAMYHRAKEWKARTVIIVGTALSKEDTLWGTIEKQLTGKLKDFADKVAPGKEKFRELLVKHKPVLILMDEVLEYATKANGVIVGKSTLAAQTLAFVQELTETASALDNVSLVITLPSSIIEHYDEGAETLYQQLQKVAGRTEKIYTPVQENEITHIIRRRLFSDCKENEAKAVVKAFVEYAERDGILPRDVQPSEYRDRFLASYPFMPEVVEVLYHRWGSFPTFQRTRGVLRLLSLVIHALKGTNAPYISLADFNLAVQEIRQELLKHIGGEFNSIIASDITDKTAGARKVDSALGDAYRGLNLGSRTATAIFLYSFSGGHEKGAKSDEIKRAATTMGNPASVIAEVLEQLKNQLLYLQNPADKYFFNNQPNLNRILLTRMENVKEEEVNDLERELLKASLKGDKLQTFIWEEKSGNITDTEKLKLVVLPQYQQETIDQILRTKGQTPRVYRNTLFFLYPLESERQGVTTTLKRFIAYKYIKEDKNLRLADDQKKEVHERLKKSEDELKEAVRRLYRIVGIPEKDRLKTLDLGIPTYGAQKDLDVEVYEALRSEGDIIEKIAPIVIREKYLTGKDYVSTEQIYQASLKTPGETRMISSSVLEQGIIEGVKTGIFGLGEITEGKPVCRYFKEPPTISFSPNEVIITEAICKEQRKKEEEPEVAETQPGWPGVEPSLIDESGVQKGKADEKGYRQTVHLRFMIPKGKVSNIMGVMNLLQNNFQKLEIDITASEGKISEQDYEDKIMETFRQSGIKIDDE